uniref:Uncharacterized protein n=1 Tax=Anguilla anguilla TaxID=7936 RepID=A0A0E9VRD4_ANGAN
MHAQTLPYFLCVLYLKQNNTPPSHIQLQHFSSKTQEVACKFRRILCHNRHSKRKAKQS